jgi:hypothetical protein
LNLRVPLWCSISLFISLRYVVASRALGFSGEATSNVVEGIASDKEQERPRKDISLLRNITYFKCDFASSSAASDLASGIPPLSAI